MTTFTSEDRIKAMFEEEEEPIPFAGMVKLGYSQAHMTQDAVAKALGISRQAVVNTEQKAFKKIREALFMRGINKEDLL